jgi:hypothetical protein
MGGNIRVNEPTLIYEGEGEGGVVGNIEGIGENIE